MSLNRSRLLSVLLCVFFAVSFLLSGAFCLTSFAENFVLYSSMTQNDTITNNLIGLYQNSPDYDPLNQYFVCRVGQYDYRIFYGADLLVTYKYYRYYGIPTGSGYGVNYYYETGEGSQLQINANGFVGVGNIEGAINHENAERFGFGYIITVLTILIAILIVFKTFRKKYTLTSDRRYTIHG